MFRSYENRQNCFETVTEMGEIVTDGFCNHGDTGRAVVAMGGWGEGGRVGGSTGERVGIYKWGSRLT